MKNIIRSIKLLYKISPFLMIALGILTTFSLFLSPLYSLIDKYLFDTLQDSYNTGLGWEEILYIVLLYFGYNLGIFILFKLIEIIRTYTQTSVSASLQKKTINNLSRMEYDRFEDNKFYNYITTVNNEINKGNMLELYQGSITIISIVITTIFLSYLLLRLSIWAVLLALLCCVPGFLHQAFFGKKNWEFNTSKVPVKRKTGYFFSLLSSIGSYKENRIYNTIPYYKEKYTDLFNEYYEDLKDFNAKNCWTGILMATVHALGTVSVIAYAYYQAANGSVSLGDAVLFVGISQSIYNNVQNAIYSLGSINEKRHSVNNILDFISTFNIEEIDNDENKHEEHSGYSNEIEMTNITYSYPGVDKKVLNGFNLKIKSGEKIAIVGKNGSGKTTLAKIILGLCQPQEGSIKINGTDIKEIPDNFRFGSACFQDFCTYSLSVRENISFGNLEKLNSDEDIYNAIDMSGLERTSFDHDIDHQITKLFDTKGFVLSGGQSQKLSLARSFMCKYGLIVLDEPSASLDVTTENEIFETTLMLMKGRTTIVITHRLANVIQCDRIVYLDSGRITEEGTHTELMKRNGEYAELFSIQAKKYMSKGD